MISPSTFSTPITLFQSPSVLTPRKRNKNHVRSMIAVKQALELLSPHSESSMIPRDWVGLSSYRYPPHIHSLTSVKGLHRTHIDIQHCLLYPSVDSIVAACTSKLQSTETYLPEQDFTILQIHSASFKDVTRNTRCKRSQYLSISHKRC